MALRSYVRTFNRLSLPKKLAAGMTAIVGIGALISIPILSLRPPSTPVVFDEDAYYKSQITDRGSDGENTTPNEAATNLDTVIPLDLPSLSNTSPSVGEGNSLNSRNESAPIGGGNSSSTGSTPNLDTTDRTNEIADNSQPKAIKPGITSNPISPPISRYTSPDSLSGNPYSQANPSTSSLTTPYSLPSPNIGSSSNTYTQPSAGSASGISTNTNPSFSSSDSPNPTSNPNNSVTPPGNPSIVPSEPAIAPQALNSQEGNFTPSTTPNGSSGNFNNPTFPNNSSGNFTPPAAANNSSGNFTPPAAPNGASGNFNNPTFPTGASGNSNNFGAATSPR